MADTQKQAIDAIKKATGWNAQPFVNGAQTESNDGPRMAVFWSEFHGSWCCQVTLFVSWIGHGDTPETAIADVLPRYRAHIAALAADVLPGWPRLEWRPFYGSQRLHLLIGCVDHPILTVDPEDWLLSIYTRPGHADVRPERTREEVWAAVKTHVEFLELPCVVPPFPEITHV